LGTAAQIFVITVSVPGNVIDGKALTDVKATVIPNYKKMNYCTGCKMKTTYKKSDAVHDFVK